MTHYQAVDRIALSFRDQPGYEQVRTAHEAMMAAFEWLNPQDAEHARHAIAIGLPRTRACLQQLLQTMGGPEKVWQGTLGHPFADQLINLTGGMMSEEVGGPAMSIFELHLIRASMLVDDMCARREPYNKGAFDGLCRTISSAYRVMASRQLGQMPVLQEKVDEWVQAFDAYQAGRHTKSGIFLHFDPRAPADLQRDLDAWQGR
jgi:hypothetical protein